MRSRQQDAIPRRQGWRRAQSFSSQPLTSQETPSARDGFPRPLTARHASDQVGQQLEDQSGVRLGRPVGAAGGRRRSQWASKAVLT